MRRSSSPVKASRAWALALWSLWSLACGRADEPTPLRVAAAADLTLAFEELGRTFEQRSGQRVIFSFGATGLLAKQLREGAPFDVFAAANTAFVDEVVKAGACDGATQRPYARGHLVWTKKGGIATPTTLAELADARFKRVAIANPDHAPYGMAARQALESAGLWETLKPRLVLGENVRQALQFAETGNVDAAIVARSLVIQDKDNPTLAVGEGLHRPIEQSLVVCTRGANRPLGQRFADFVASDEGRSIMARYGFALPDPPTEAPR
ncbi:MAG TPA: molybdate ABC transporter substrate-binding protein [Myxococcota bacterium]|nr:molybdate ABC transporter substrate-binding protein [Myxococcota bacterium]